MHCGLDEPILRTEVFALIAAVVGDDIESRCPLSVRYPMLYRFFTRFLFNNMDAAVRRTLGEADKILDQDTSIGDIR